MDSHNKDKIEERDEFHMDPRDLAELGGGEIAYVREISKEQANEILGNVPIEGVVYSTRFFVLHAANGRLIAISDSKEAIHMNARENRLSAVSVH